MEKKDKAQKAPRLREDDYAVQRQHVAIGVYVSSEQGELRFRALLSDCVMLIAKGTRGPDRRDSLIRAVLPEALYSW